ncbi:ChbG/HpnK family deacetylase [Paucibacter sp. APW11]|uniref:ChbG/HpnK family deacetylase n=1 Tax=Roseateles aquae TaxID=3077235 RepID=A0ABU3P5J7_9BURK|nr:ChbG/HpnK family deacetylase [Paucibacter sp. APW11]MDT8997840.1 ChbG/HpnK family deacetylase [Paucibacter sp. APW11]
MSAPAVAKRIQICADDYGFDRAISQAILDGIDMGRLSATSCMVLSPAWAACAPALRDREGAADFGLHLDLSEFAPYAPGRSLQGWIAAAYLRRISLAEAAQWVGSQLDAFEAGLGRAPDYVDGHQHLHQLPVIREAVLTALQARYGRRCALRITTSRQWRGTKAAVIGALGAAALASGAARLGLAGNRDFAGVYDFSPATDYSALVRGWLKSLPDGGLLMTHPGLPGDTETRADAIRAARVREYEFWRSTESGELLAELGVQLGLCQDWR